MKLNDSNAVVIDDEDKFLEHQRKNELITKLNQTMTLQTIYERKLMNA